MPVGPQEQQLLAMMAAGAEGDPGPLDPDGARAAYRALASVLPPGPDVGVFDRTIPGPDGDIGVRVYTPDGEGPFGTLLFLHGGGWTIGDLDTHDHPCRSLCHDAGIVVVSVDYRLAPEHPYPAGLDDAWAVLEWLAVNGAELRADPTRLAVGGDSAGGNLAAVLALRARDRGGPALLFQLLVYPGIDLRLGADERYPSRRDNADGYVLTRAHLEFFIASYLPDPSRGHEWEASPLLAADLTGLPRALVITAEFDPLRDEGAAYAVALADAGTAVTHTLYPGTIHTMFQLAPLLDSGRAALAQSAEALATALGSKR